MTDGQPFTLGVNYWPRCKAMYWWSHFDAGEVRDEFALIVSLGLQVVRLFLLWDDFQPTPDAVDKTCLQNFGKVCNIAAEHNLKLDVTFFTGHMSGPNWAPRWLLGGPRPGRRQGRTRQVVSGGRPTPKGYRNFYHDPLALAAEKLQLQAVVGNYKDHPAVWMWNLGNEPDLFDWPNSPQAGRQWVKEMTSTIRALDAAHPITCGLHAASLMEHNNLRVDQVFGETDAAVMHAYPMYSPVARHPLDPDFVPFTCALTASLCGRPVLMEEFGGCTAPPGEPSQTWKWRAYDGPRAQFMASEEDLAEYLRQCLPRLVEVGAVGALVWCFADYIPELWDRPPCDHSRHERFFGLVRPDGSLKPHAQVLKEFAATRPTVRPIPEFARLPIRADEFYDAASQPYLHLPDLYETYLSRKGI
ncbi:MAG: cellulase family glycosylhydrolase [Chloroflexota bacterium]